MTPTEVAEVLHRDPGAALCVRPTADTGLVRVRALRESTWSDRFLFAEFRRPSDTTWQVAPAGGGLVLASDLVTDEEAQQILAEIEAARQAHRAAFGDALRCIEALHEVGVSADLIDGRVFVRDVEALASYLADQTQRPDSHQVATPNGSAPA